MFPFLIVSWIFLQFVSAQLMIRFDSETVFFTAATIRSSNFQQQDYQSYNSLRKSCSIYHPDSYLAVFDKPEHTDFIKYKLFKGKIILDLRGADRWTVANLETFGVREGWIIFLR